MKISKRSLVFLLANNDIDSISFYLGLLKKKSVVTFINPLIEILQNPDIKKNIGEKFDLGVYIKSYHMMLRDVEGDFVTREIKEWIFKRKNISYLNSFKNPIEKLLNQPYYHILD